MKIFEFQNCIVSFPKGIGHIIFDDEYCYGIKFYIDDTCYQLLHNREADWYRFLLNTSNFHWKDMPFHEGTWRLLPKGVVVRRKSNE